MKLFYIIWRAPLPGEVSRVDHFLLLYYFLQLQSNYNKDGLVTSMTKFVWREKTFAMSQSFPCASKPFLKRGNVLVQIYVKPKSFHHNEQTSSGVFQHSKSFQSIFVQLLKLLWVWCWTRGSIFIIFISVYWRRQQRGSSEKGVT